jgi:SulP family sulfate permease
VSLKGFQLKQLFPVATIGFAVGAITLPILLSFGVLIYSGDLASYASLGIGMTLFCAVVIQLVIAATGSLPGVVGGTQDSPAAILAVAGAAVSSAMIGASLEARFATVLAMVMLTTFLTGLVFILLGTFKLSRFVRFIPYPVVGGFIAGTGLLLMQGSFSVMLDGMPGIAKLFSSDILMRWLPGMVFGIALVVATKKINHILVTPAVLLLGVILFYGYLFIFNISFVEARAAGMLLGPFPEGSLWKPISFALLKEVDWSLIAGQAHNIGAVIMISGVTLLLNASALELIGREDFDLNRELISTGLANMLGAFTGGSAGYHYLSLSALSMRSKVQSRWTGVFSAAVLMMALIFGSRILSFVPKYMVGGVLIYIGLSFLIEWIYDAWFNLPRLEYVLVLVIVVIVGWFGFLQGVTAGVLFAVILFVINYSRIDIVHNAFTGETYRSRVDRPAEHLALLNTRGSSINILQLDGFVFFGTAQALLNRVRERIKNQELPALRFLILDFRRVSALDSSAVFSFIRIQQMASANNFHLFLSDISPQSLATLRKGGLDDRSDAFVHVYPTMDEAVGFCEERIILDEGGSTVIRAASIQSQLQKVFSSKEAVDKFMHYLAREEMDEFHILIRQGDPPGAMYFVEYGELAARLEVANNKFMRLRTMGPGTTVGEIGLYLQIPSTATVAVNKKSILYKLTQESLRRMEMEEPMLASSLHRWIVLTLSRRLSDNNRTMEALLK